MTLKILNLLFNTRRNFICFEETLQSALMLILDALFHWCVRAIFLYTEFFSGPDQFFIELVFIAVPADFLITLYFPFSWIRSSSKGRWAGWGATAQAAQFRYVRIPDPREELLKKGYFKKSRKYLYVSNKQTGHAIGCEGIAINPKHLNCEPLNAETLSIDQIEEELMGTNLSRSRSPVYLSLDNINNIETEHFYQGKSKKFGGGTSKVLLDNLAHGSNYVLNPVIQVKPYQPELTIPIFKNSKKNIDLQIIIHKECDQEPSEMLEEKNRPDTNKNNIVLKTNKETFKDILIINQHKDKILNEIRTIGETIEPNRYKEEGGKIEMFGIN